MSVESFLIAELVAEKSLRKAFQSGLSQEDFDLYDEEFSWLCLQAEKKLPITVRRFKKKFPDFEFIRSGERIQDLIEELKQERAFISVKSALDEVEMDLDHENAVEKATQLREILGDVIRVHAPASDVLIKSEWQKYLEDQKRISIMGANGELPGIPTGLKNLDYHWGGLQGGNLYLVLGRPGDAKALEINTPIPTPDGWKVMGELQIGDMVFDELGQPTKVKWVGEPYIGDCYRVNFSDGISLVADGEHQWVTWTRGARRYEKARVLVNARKERPQCLPVETSLPQVRTTNEIKETICCQTADQRLNHSIRNTLPLETPEKDLPIDPYVLGAWLGDGTTVDGAITSADPEIISEIEDVGYVCRKRSSGSRGKANVYGILGLRKQLRELGVLGNKRIPPVYLRASENQRLRLLQGIADTDGGWDGRSVKIALSNKRLSQDVYELVVSLGMTPYRRQEVPILNGKACSKSYQLKFSPIVQVFCLHRKAKKYIKDRGQENRRTHRYITSIEKTVDVVVRCIGVNSSSQLFLAGKQMIPTHNSMLLAKFAVEAMFDGRRVGVFSPEMNERQHRCRFSTLISANPTVQQALGLKGAFRNRALMDGRGYNLKSFKRFLEYCETELPGEICLFTQTYRRDKMSASYIETRMDDLGLELVLIDPIYKLRYPRKRSLKHEEIGDIVDSIQNLSMSFNVPIVISNQATRSLVGTRGEAPSKDTSFGSDAPAQEADIVIGVKHFSDERLIKLACTKNRFGDPFRFGISFWPNVGKMEDVTPIKGDFYNGYDPEKAEELREVISKVESEVNA